MTTAVSSNQNSTATFKKGHAHRRSAAILGDFDSMGISFFNNNNNSLSSFGLTSPIRSSFKLPAAGPVTVSSSNENISLDELNQRLHQYAPVIQQPTVTSPTASSFFDPVNSTTATLPKAKSYSSPPLPGNDPQSFSASTIIDLDLVALAEESDDQPVTSSPRLYTNSFNNPSKLRTRRLHKRFGSAPEINLFTSGGNNNNNNTLSSPISSPLQPFSPTCLSSISSVSNNKHNNPLYIKSNSSSNAASRRSSATSSINSGTPINIPFSPTTNNNDSVSVSSSTSEDNSNNNQAAGPSDCNSIDVSNSSDINNHSSTNIPVSTTNQNHNTCYTSTSPPALSSMFYSSNNNYNGSSASSWYGSLSQQQQQQQQFPQPPSYSMYGNNIASNGTSLLLSQNNSSSDIAIVEEDEEEQELITMMSPGANIVNVYSGSNSNTNSLASLSLVSLNSSNKPTSVPKLFENNSNIVASTSNNPNSGPSSPIISSITSVSSTISTTSSTVSNFTSSSAITSTATTPFSAASSSASLPQNNTASNARKKTPARYQNYYDSSKMFKDHLMKSQENLQKLISSSSVTSGTSSTSKNGSSDHDSATGNSCFNFQSVVYDLDDSDAGEQDDQKPQDNSALLENDFDNKKEEEESQVGKISGTASTNNNNTVAHTKRKSFVLASLLSLNSNSGTDGHYSPLHSPDLSSATIISKASSNGNVTSINNKRSSAVSVSTLRFSSVGSTNSSGTTNTTANNTPQLQQLNSFTNSTSADIYADDANENAIHSITEATSKVSIQPLSPPQAQFTQASQRKNNGKRNSISSFSMLLSRSRTRNSLFSGASSSGSNSQLQIDSSNMLYDDPVVNNDTLLLRTKFSTKLHSSSFINNGIKRRGKKIISWIKN